MVPKALVAMVMVAKALSCHGDGRSVSCYGEGRCGVSYWLIYNTCSIAETPARKKSPGHSCLPEPPAR